MISYSTLEIYVLWQAIDYLAFFSREAASCPDMDARKQFDFAAEELSSRIQQMLIEKDSNYFKMAGYIENDNVSLSEALNLSDLTANLVGKYKL